MNLSIYDYEILQEPKVATKIKINIAELVFNKSAKFYVYYQLENDDIAKAELINIENDDYKNWNNDDNYIINLICEKLGVRLQNKTTTDVDHSPTISTISNEDLGITEPA